MADTAAATMRIDRFLWFARLAKSRAIAQAMAESGAIRVDGRRVDRAHLPVRAGAVIAMMHSGRVRVFRIDRLPVRRGPAAEAALLVSTLDDAGRHPCP